MKITLQFSRELSVEEVGNLMDIIQGFEPEVIGVVSFNNEIWQIGGKKPRSMLGCGLKKTPDGIKFYEYGVNESYKI
jgi:hypothetical protein